MEVSESPGRWNKFVGGLGVCVSALLDVLLKCFCQLRGSRAVDAGSFGQIDWEAERVRLNAHLPYCVQAPGHGAESQGQAVWHVISVDSNIVEAIKTPQPADVRFHLAAVVRLALLCRQLHG
jgi:hypothetical protein